MDVRPAAPGDVAGIQHVARQGWEAAHEPIVGEAAVREFLAEHYGAEAIWRRVVADDDVFYVADDDGVVGFAAARSLDDAPELYGLENLYVHPNRWGEGVGTRLVERVERAVRADGGSRVRLAVMAENDRAVAFYESVGYERIQEGRDDRLDVARYRYARDL